MSTHVPGAPYAAIHSVCVHPDHRRKGVALSLLKAYLARLSDTPGILGARFITHKELIPLYSKAAFELVGESAVVHGARKWYEMRIDFGGASGQSALANKEHEKAEHDKQRKETAVQTGEPEPESLDEKKDTMQVGEVKKEEAVVAQRNPGPAWIAFNGKLELLVDGDQLNKAGLYCPRPECRCLLLRAGAGKWVLPSENEFEVSRAARRRCLPPRRPPFAGSAIVVADHSLSHSAAPGTASSSGLRTTSVQSHWVLVRALSALVREHRLLAQRHPARLHTQRHPISKSRPGQVPYLRRL